MRSNKRGKPDSFRDGLTYKYGCNKNHVDELWEKLQKHDVFLLKRGVQDFPRGFVKKLEANDKVPETELFAMGLQPHVRPVPGRLPVPTESPEVEVVAGKTQEVDVYVLSRRRATRQST